MVMHARKLPRLNDGYFDRNQAHPYENSSKYSSKLKLGSRYNDKVRESPSNGSSHGRSNSPDSRHSPRYHKFSYNQRLKERDKDHERGYIRYDSKYRNASGHVRYSRASRYKSLSGSSKSPAYKDRVNKSSLGSGSSSNNKDQHSSKSCSSDVSAHRTNHDRSHNEENKEKRQQVGDWSEHVSSSGKKYYYNCKTEVSQWEKPKEWIEWEKQQGIYKSSSSSGGGSDSSSRSKPRSHERQATSSSASGGCNVRQGEKHSSSATVSSSTRAYQHSSRPHNDTRRSSASSSRGSDPRKDSQMQDMDISPASSGTPTSCHESLPQSRNVTPSSQAAPSLLLSPSQVTLANLPKMMSQLAGTRGLPNLDDMSPQEAFRTIQQALQLTKQAQTTGLSQATSSCVTQTEGLKGTSPSMYQAHTTPIASHRATQSSSGVCMPGLPLPAGLQGPPLTPGTLDGKGASAGDCRDGGAASPGSDYSAHSSRRDSPTSCVSSLHSISGTGTSSLASAVLKPAVPSLTPSLANYYNESLISHVTGWQADHAERQANRYSEEAHTLGSLNCTRVSAELKMARSLVRLAEIQATLQEQRTLFLRQQIKELEELKSQVKF
ncbi:WW domain-containing adapter protein with coiled-coil-like isoform X2 [Ornithodoros turicata]|uniref:WW domain-containing adapter protein with coiled-coil-like isoform X2 n=1 Tax=Ornithodoros turicata TaxID=34597 RepID=UPI003138CEBE